MKAIFITFTATISVVTFAGSLFLNTILGAFGYTAVAVNTLQKLTATSQVMKTIKTRHKDKKLKKSKRFVKRASRKVATTTAAAATIGTIAVAVTMVSLEVADYCEDKKELQEDENIIFGTNKKFEFQQCIDEAEEDSKTILDEVKNDAIKMGSKAFEATKAFGAKQLKSASDYTLRVFEFYDNATDNLWDDASSLWNGK